MPVAVTVPYATHVVLHIAFHIYNNWFKSLSFRTRLHASMHADAFNGLCGWTSRIRRRLAAHSAVFALTPAVRAAIGPYWLLSCANEPMNQTDATRTQSARAPHANTIHTHTHTHSYGVRSVHVRQRSLREYDIIIWSSVIGSSRRTHAHPSNIMMLMMHVRRLVQVRMSACLREGACVSWQCALCSVFANTHT